jgi:Sigma-54 interaction domain
METMSRVCAGATRAAGPLDRASLTSEESRLAQEAHEELLLVGMARVNFLLMGSGGIVQSVLDTFLSRASQPIDSWFPGETLVLPPVDRAGTMVLHEVGKLGIRDQIQMLEWLGQAMGRTQVVSTTSASLLPRVQAGAFIDTLYYRLNTVCVDVGA